MKARAKFCGNPWGLTGREAMAVWLLGAFKVRVIADKMGISPASVNCLLMGAYARMGVTHAAPAAVEFDRWWQQHKRDVDDETVRLFEIELMASPT